MQRGLLVGTLLLIAPSVIAQVPYYGTFGIYDDPAHTQPFGSMNPGSKTIYLGVDLYYQALNGLTALEFSVAGLDAVSLLSMDVQPPPAVVFGDIHAPVDTMLGSGGINIAWATCIPDSVVSIALTIVSDAPPKDQIFQVLRRFPPSWLSDVDPFASPCDVPWDGRLFLQGRRYTLNPTTATESGTWSAVKYLFRSP